LCYGVEYWEIITPRAILISTQGGKMEDTEHDLGLDAIFIDEEEIVPKLQLIEDREHSLVYQHSADKGMCYFERCEMAIRAIPSEYRKFAWALFANVIYLPRDLLDCTWYHLLNKAAQKLNVLKEEIVNNGLLLEVDAANLCYEFIQKCRIPGRLDTDKFPRQITTIGVLLSTMISIISESPSDEQRGILLDCLKKKFWLLLADNSLSGTSLCSEINKLNQIFTLLPNTFQLPYIIVLIQVLTEDAKRELDNQLKAISLKNIMYIPAVQLNSDFKINDDRCKLFNKTETREGVLRFCEWFAQNTPLANDPDMKATKLISKDDLRYGFKSVGLTLVTPNCPTNSVPPLWYPTIDKIDRKSTKDRKPSYIPPFPRLHSRPRQSSSKDKEHLAILQQKRNEICEKIK
jgi:hypothetical protein